MSETTKMCADCAEFRQGNCSDCRVPAAPSPEAGEREVREALVRVLMSARSDRLDALDELLGTRHSSTFADTADALLSRRAPRVEAGEVTDAMVEAFASADYCAKGRREQEHPVESCDECIRIGLTAALRTGVTATKERPRD